MAKITWRTYGSGPYAGVPHVAHRTIIPPYRNAGGVPELMFKLPSVNATQSNLVNTQGQGGDPTPATRHFRMLIADWGKFYLNDWRTNNVQYSASIEHIDGTYNNFWPSNNVEGHVGQGHGTQVGHAEYNMKLRVGDTVRATINVAAGFEAEEVRFYIEDDDAPPSVFNYPKTFANGVKASVPVTTQRHVVVDLCGAAQDVLTNGQLDFTFVVTE